MANPSIFIDELGGDDLVNRSYLPTLVLHGQSDENTNSLLRQYFPKGTDPCVNPEKYLDAVAEELNDKPHKTLGRRKPSEIFLDLISASPVA